MEFKKKLRELMNILNVFTYKELAEKLEISESAVKAWGKRQVIPKKYEEILNKDSSNDSFSLEIEKMISKLPPKRQEYYFYLIKAELLNLEK